MCSSKHWWKEAVSIGRSNKYNGWESKKAPLACGPMGNLVPLAAASRLD